VADEQRIVGCPLVFVAVETAVGEAFHGFLARLDAAQRLDRVILDEAHLILTSSDYRPKMRLIRQLRNLRAQFVFLTGTLPPSMLQAFQQKLLLSEPTVIRSTTFRKDLRYTVERLPTPGLGQSFLQLAAQAIRTKLAQAELHDEAAGRAIVYSTRRHEVDTLATLLDCEVYYSDSGTVQQKAAVMERWRSGARRVIAATSAFGMGVDYGHVRVVFHMGVPSEAVGFAQEVGRLGRDGGGGQSIVLIAAETGRSTAGLEAIELLPEPAQVMRRYVGEPRCHAAVLSRFLDGEAGQWYCEAEEAERRCSRCGQLGRWSDEAVGHDGYVEEDTGPSWARDSDGERQTATEVTAAAAEEEEGEKEEEKEEEEEEEEKEEEEEEEDGDRETNDEVGAGPTSLRRCLRDEERDQRRYVQRLRQWQGLCMICRLLGGTRGGDRSEEWRGEWHGLDQCRHRRKGDFFQAKRQAVQQGRQRGGWIAAYRACFGCGNPQEVCDRPGGKRQERCEFGDMVFPASWAVFHMENRFGRSLEELTGRGFRDEASWMRWLGEKCELYGMATCHAVMVADWALEQLE
jgi:superfamily II DNA/RNA helicase